MQTRKYMVMTTACAAFFAIPFFGRTTGAAPGARVLNPPHVLQSSISVPPAIGALLRRACYNCHSNETRWPWYSHLPLASRLIARDVERGRRTMNFSEWSEQVGNRPAMAAGNLLASCAAIQAGQMPKSPYRLMHPEARLSKPEVDQFCGWANSEARLLLAARRK